MSKKQSSQKITALYARLSRDDENEDVSGSIKNQRAMVQLTITKESKRFSFARRSAEIQVPVLLTISVRR